MSNYGINPSILTKAQLWTKPPYDDQTRQAVSKMIKNDPAEVEESFYKDLEFGTGGLRGVMGFGTNRMNKYTVGMATQGLANYLSQVFKNEEIKVAIAYDSRNNNTFFAQIAANVLSANGIKVYLFDALRPTPELSFAIRHLGCHSGIVITASHNPKEYNGYKVYWKDGGQLVPPHDMNVINEVKKIASADLINFNAREELIEMIGSKIDEAYIKAMKEQSLSPDLIRKHSDLKIVYTPIHGTGVKLVPMALKAFGFQNVFNVPEQDVTDGNFPTVHSPNPEENAALELALNKAKQVDADIVMATDPDADRVGIAVRNDQNELILLNGNQTATLLVYYLLKRWKEKGKLNGKQFIAKTIVTTDLLSDIAFDFDVKVEEVLTGFKYIAEVIRLNEGKLTFIGGGEESYGYLIGDYVRDKDAVVSCCMIAEVAAWAREKGLTLFELLNDIYREFGIYYEGLVSVTKKGKKGAEEIQSMIKEFRSNPPKEIAGEKIVRIIDYQSGKDHRIVDETISSVTLPKSNVLQFFTEGGIKITVRPSGTEPKIKFYFALKGKLGSNELAETVIHQLKQKIETIRTELGV